MYPTVVAKHVLAIAVFLMIALLAASRAVAFPPNHLAITADDAIYIVDPLGEIVDVLGFAGQQGPC